MFTGKILDDYTQSFEMILATNTIYDCAKNCFQLNCTRGAFTHFPRSACLLHFSSIEEPIDLKCKESEKLISNWEFTNVPEVVEITCIKCLRENFGKSNSRLHDEFSLDNFRRISDTEPHHIINPQGL